MPLRSPVPLPPIYLRRVAYTFDTTELSLATRGYGSLVIIPNVFSLQNIALSLTVHLQNVSTLVVVFSGDFVVGKKTIPVKAVYSRASGTAKITAAISKTTINFQSIAKKLLGLNLPSALQKSVTVPRFTIAGLVTSSKKSQLIISSTRGNVQVYIIYKNAGTSQKAIAVELPSVKLASVLRDMIGQDISGIPYFGSTVLPKIALVYASRDVSLPKNIFVKSSLLSNIGSSLKKGFTALIKFSFSGQTVKLHYNRGSLLTFGPVIPGSLKVKNLASVIPKFDLSRVPLPPGVNGVLKLSIESFSFNIKTKGMKLIVGYPGTLKFFNGLLNVYNLKLTIVKDPTRGIKVDVEGNLRIARREFYVTFTQNKKSGEYILNARAKRLPITINFQSIAKKLVGLNLPSALRKSVTVSRLAIKGMVAPGKSELIVSSTVGNVQVYIIYKTPQKAIAVEMSNIKLASIIDDILGLGISRIPYFGSATIPKIALTYATHDISLPKNTFTNSRFLSKIGGSLKKGFTALIKFSFSSDPVKLYYGGGSLLKFTPAVPGRLNVKTLISIIPKFDLSRVPLPPGVSGVLKLSIEAFSLNIKSKSMKLIVGYPGTLKFFNGMLNVYNLKLTILKSPTQGVKINVEGDLRISQREFYVSFTQYKKSGKYIFNARAKRLPITINFQSIAKKLVGLNLPSALRKSVTVSRLAIKGMVASGKSELIVSSTVGNVQVYIIYKKAITSRKAIALEMSNVKLASVLDDVLRLGISRIPYFGTAVIPKIALTYATHNINLPKKIFVKSPFLSNIGSRLKKGFTAIIKFSFSGRPMKLHYGGGSILKFSPAIPGSLKVKTLTSAIPRFDLSRVPLPPGVSGVLNIGIETFDLNIKTKSMKLVVKYPGSLKFFNGLLRVQHLRIQMLKGPTKGIKLEIDGDLSISGQKFQVSITQHRGKYILRAQARRLPITSLMRQFHTEILPSELSSLLNKLPFFRFSIHNPSITLPFSSSPPQIQLQGVPAIRGYRTVRMSSEIIKQGGKTLLVQGFELGSINLANFLKSITGFNFKRIAMLNLNVEATILISPANMPNIHLAGGKLKGLSIKKGVSVQANMKFPPSCSKDKFCAVAQSLLGADAVLNLHGTIASANTFTLFAGVSNLNLGRGIVMSQAGVEVQGGTMNSIGIVGAVDLSNPDITLAARVFLSTSGVVLEMTMTGCWKNAFGAKWLDICSLKISVAMVPGVPLPTALSFGGEVHIGYKKCGTPISGTGFVGIDAITPTNNYYYVNIKGSTTVGTILRALCIRFQVPAPLARSGFPRGFISSFSLAGVELPHVPLSIPLGYRLSGTLDILGLQGSADVTIGLPNGIRFKVALSPINIVLHGRTLLRMTISRRDTSRGPMLNAEITLLPRPKVSIEASGYVSVLGISLETMLKITNTQYIFNIRGNMLHLFEANLRIYASWGNIRRANFQVQGSFTNKLYSTLENVIKNSLNKAGKAASAKLAAARKELRKFRSSFNRAESAFRAGRRKLNDAQRHFNAASGKVRSLSRRVNSICHIRSCGSRKY